MPVPVVTDGKRANRSGRTLENFVKDKLMENYTEVSTRNFWALRILGQAIFAVQCPVGETLYKTKRIVDFVLYHPQKWPDCLVIQCKWQQTSGSVDEKYPYEVLSIAENDYDTIIVLDGEKYRKEAEQWLKNQAGKDGLANNRLRYVLSLSELGTFQSQGKI